MNKEKSTNVLFEWSYNPWIKDRFRTLGRFIVIIFLGLLSTLIFKYFETSIINFLIPAILVIFALNIRSFLESRFIVFEDCVKPDVGRVVNFKDVIGWRVSTKYLRLVVARQNLRRELISWDLPDDTELLKNILNQKLGTMLESNEKIKTMLKEK